MQKDDCGQQSNDTPDMDSNLKSQTKSRSLIRIRLYRNPTDYETRYLAEVEVPRTPGGGLNLRDLPGLFQVNGTFDVSNPPHPLSGLMDLLYR